MPFGGAGKQVKAMVKEAVKLCRTSIILHKNPSFCFECARTQQYRMQFVV